MRFNWYITISCTVKGYLGVAESIKLNSASEKNKKKWKMDDDVLIVSFCTRARMWTQQGTLDRKDAAYER